MNPADLKGVRDAVLDSAGSLAVAGAGTAAGWAGALQPVDAVLDLRALTGVIAHNPGDMTVSVRAGTPLRELNAELADHGQHVAFDAARVADGATVGGLLATADAGPDALVHGSLRDLVIGTTLVLADGTVARNGGHVIKNVAGYDLAKLVHGSYGTLAVVAEVVLRLHPLPRAVATLVLPCTLDEAAGHAARILGGPYEPAALEWVSDPGALLVRVEGTEAALPERVARLQELLGPAAVPVEGPSPAPSDAAAPSAVPADGPSNGEAHSDGTQAPDLAAASGASGAAAGAGAAPRAWTRPRGSPSRVTSGPVAGTGPTRVPLAANRGRVRGRERGRRRVPQRGQPRVPAGPTTRGPGTRGSPAGPSTTPCCASGCGPPGCPACSRACPPARSPRAWERGSRPSRCPPTPPRSPRRTPRCTRRAGRRCCAAARPRSTDPPGARRRPRSRCSAPSRRNSTPPAGSDRAGSRRG